MKIILALAVALFALASTAQAADHYGACQGVIDSQAANHGAAVVEIYNLEYNNSSGILTIYAPTEPVLPVWQGDGAALGDRDGFTSDKFVASFVAEVIDAVARGRFFYYVTEEIPGSWKAYYAFITLKGVCVSSFFPSGTLRLGELPLGIMDTLRK